MSKGRVLTGIITLGCFLLFGYLYYDGKYTNDGILENVKERDGYTLNMVKNKETVELYIEPEWIPFKNSKEQKYDIKLADKHKTTIKLVQVRNRGDDIFFSFDTTYNLDYTNGTFMYNGIFNKDGTYTTNGIYEDFYLVNNDGERIDIGQSGQGPYSAFGFAVEEENYDLIRDGFYVQYSGFYLYEYNKN